MDYASLAKQNGGSVQGNIPQNAPSQPTGNMDYASLAKLHGGTVETPQAPGYFQRVGNSISGAVNDIGSAVKESFNNPQGGLGDVLGTAARLAKDVTGAVVSPITEAVAPVAGAVFNPVVNAINNTAPLQATSDFMSHYPKLTDFLSNSIETAGNVFTAVGAAETVPKVTNVIKKAASTVKNDVTGAVSNVAEKVGIPTGTQTLDTQMQGVANDWKKPTLENKPSYNNARAVLEKDPGVPDFLAENKMNPFSHIEDGKYNTESSAQSMRDAGGNFVKDAIRPSLHTADYTTPKIAVDSLKVTPDSGGYGITAGDAKTIQANIDSELNALKEKYPDGMSLVNQLDEKITYDKNGGYKPYKSNADNNTAIANRSIANSLRASLDANVPKDLPLTEANQYASKFYKAADYLDALNGKKAPVSLAQNVIRYGARLAGAKVGGLVGGDIVSEFAGYHLAKFLEQQLENMTNPMRDAFLNNMKVTNPTVLDKLVNYARGVKNQAETSLKLPQGKPLGTQGNPIIPSAPTTFEPSAKVSNTTSYNPKTGTQYVKDLKTGRIKIIQKPK